MSDVQLVVSSVQERRGSETKTSNLLLYQTFRWFLDNLNGNV